mgnify:FL=1
MRSGKTLKDVPFDSIPLSHIKPKSLIDLFTKPAEKNREKSTTKNTKKNNERVSV